MNLTYEKNRGYWHWVCVKCGARGREMIPDQAYLEVAELPQFDGQRIFKK